MHAIINNFHNNRLTKSRKNFREISWLVFFRQFVQGIISLASLRKSVRYLGRGVKKATQITVMISNDEKKPESDPPASFIILPFFFLFGS